MRGWAVVALLAVGCGEPSPPGDGPTTGGSAGAAGSGGAPAIEAGAVLPCPPGELVQDGGSCLAPGIGPDGCGDGFAHDGEYGCEPVLPAAACGPGEIAVPGDRACRPVGACTGGTWGAIPVDATTVYVDGSFAGVSTGSATQPFTSVQQAVDAAASGAIVAIAAGLYGESVHVDRAVVLWGVCPSAVSIESPAGAAIDVGATAPRVVVRDLGCSGQGRGVLSRGAPDVLLERVWIHDTGHVGLEASAGTVPSTVVMRDSSIEGGWFRSAVAMGATLVVERSLIRGAAEASGQAMGIGGFRSGDDAATITVRQSVVEDSPSIGIQVVGSSLEVEGSVIRAVRPNEAGGQGLAILSRASGESFASITVRASLVEAAHTCGICAHEADLAVERTVVRDIAPTLAGGGEGTGIRLASYRPDLGQRPAGRIEQTLVERTQQAGVQVKGADVVIQRLVVRDVAARSDDGTAGRGISIEYGDGANEQRGAAQIRGCRVERSHEVGILIVGSDGSIDSCLVSDTRARDSDGLLGAGLAFVPDKDVVDERPVGTVTRTVVERSRAGGIGAVASDVTLLDVIVRDTLTEQALDDFGDGIVASSTLLLAPGYHPTLLDVTRATVARSARAGVAAFGAPVRIRASWLDCNGLDLNGEQDAEAPFSIEDLGGNVCGCGDEVHPCQVLSSGFGPPPGL